MKYQFEYFVIRTGRKAAVFLLLVACACSLVSGQAVLQFQVAVPDVATPEPAPAAPADPAPAQVPARAAVRPAPVIRLFPSPAVVAPTPVTTLIGILDVNASANTSGVQANQVVVLAAPFPNPFLYGVHLFAANERDVALASAKLAQQQAAKRRVAVARPLVAGVVANNVEAQMRKMLEPMLKTEISFAVRAMDLNAREKKTLVAASKQWFDKFLPDFIKKQDPNQQQMMLQGAQAIFFGNQERPENPRESIRRQMAKLIPAAFSKEKATRYAAECRKREEFAHQVAVDNLVERLDERVKLSPDQWKKITKALNDHWDKKHEPQLEAFVYNNNMWPGTPDQWVLPELTLAQKNVIKRINTMNGQIFFGGGMLGAFMGGDADVIDDDIQVEAQGGAANPFQ